jgi:hypothetical protein
MPARPHSPLPTPQPTPRRTPHPARRSFARASGSLLALLLALGLSACAEPPAPLLQGLLPLDAQGRPYAPEDEFEIDGRPLEYRQRAEFHDFGLVPLGATVEHTWRLQNTDDMALRVHKLTTSCGCTEARLQLLDAAGRAIERPPSVAPDLLEIPAGARVDLNIHIDTRAIHTKNSDKLVQVTLITNSKQRPYSRYEAHLIADSPLQLTPEGFELGRVPANVGASASIDILPVGGSWTVPDAISGVPAGYTARLEAREAGGREYWTIVLDALAPVAPGPLRGEFVLTTKRPKDKPQPGVNPLQYPEVEWVPGLTYTLKLAGQGIGDLDVFPGQLAVRGKRGESARGEVQLASGLPGHRLLVKRARVELPAGVTLSGVPLDVETLPLDPDDSGRTAKWTIALIAPPGFAAPPLAGEVVVELDDLQFPEVRIPFLVRLD